MRQIKRYTGQFVGGPDDGNMITSSVSEVYAEVTHRNWPDGLDAPPVVLRVAGWYVWNDHPVSPYFIWRHEQSTKERERP